MSTKDLINAIVIGDAIAIENAFEATMAEKISARLDDMRVEVAQSMFKVQESVELEEEQLDELSVFKLDAYRKKAREYSDAVPSSGKPGPLSKERKKAIRRDVGAEMADDKIKAKTGTYHPGLIAKVKDKYFSKTNEEVELEEAADMAKLRQQLDKHSEAAIKANREGNDEAVKKHQVQMNKIKDKMAKLARNEEVELDEEQLDELSKTTLGSYVKKASSDLVGKGAVAAMQSSRGDVKSAEKTGAKTFKRHVGISKAIDKLTKEEAEEILASEEFEQLDELSKTTLGNYVKKASKDAQLAARFQHSSKEDNEHGAKIRAKRNAGIAKAVDKLAK